MIFSYLLNMQSHPSWVCGLKRCSTEVHTKQFRSHPSWVCGLKHKIPGYKQYKKRVTPFVGVWIETQETPLCFLKGSSHPSWVCGLKHAW